MTATARNRTTKKRTQKGIAGYLALLGTILFVVVILCGATMIYKENENRRIEDSIPGKEHSIPDEPTIPKVEKNVLSERNVLTAQLRGSTDKTLSDPKSDPKLDSIAAITPIISSSPLIPIIPKKDALSLLKPNGEGKNMEIKQNPYNVTFVVRINEIEVG